MKKEFQKKRIDELCYKLGISRGLVGVSMEDIAREVGVSKKTLYNYYANKEALIKSVIVNVLNVQQKIAEENMLKALDPIHHGLLSMIQLKNIVKPINPIVFFELKKYYPEVWEVFESFKQEWFFRATLFCLMKGKEMGLFREEIDCEVLSYMRAMQLNAAMSTTNEIPEGKDLYDIMEELTAHFYHGIVTPKGRELLEHYLKNGVE